MCLHASDKQLRIAVNVVRVRLCSRCSQAEVFGKNLTQLASLRLPGCGLTDFDLLGLRPLTSLTLLDLGDATEVM